MRSGFTARARYEEIVAQINHGVTKEESKSGIAMPPQGRRDAER